MKFLTAALLAFAPTLSFAAEKCENYAKFFAIQEYKNSVGTVQGSEDLQYSAELISVNSDEEYLFQVEVYDSNEDGEAWQFLYDVTVKPVTGSDKCALEKISGGVQEP